MNIPASDTSAIGREIIASLFYEMLEEFTMKGLQDFHPQKAFLPIPGLLDFIKEEGKV